MSRREINALVRLLQESLSTGSRGNGSGRAKQPQQGARTSRNRRRRRARQATQPPPIGQPGMPSSTNPRRRAARVVGNAGLMRVSRDELLASVTTGDTGDATLTIMLDPVRSASYFPWLSGIATSWERVQWHSLELSWRSAVGTTTDGLVTYSFDWNSPTNSTTAPDRKTVTSNTPVADHPVWQTSDRAALRAPASQLKSRHQFIMGSTDANDASPCSVILNVSGAPKKKNVGELWIRYDVTMAGPRKASS